MTNTTHEKVFKRLRTNEALEEDLALANKEIARLQGIIEESLEQLEASEMPFYVGMRVLKDYKK